MFITAVPITKLFAWGGTREEPGTLTQGVALFSSRLGIEPKTPPLGGWCKTQPPAHRLRSSRLRSADVDLRSHRPRQTESCALGSCLGTAGSVARGVFSAANDMLVEHALLAAAVCALLALFLAGTQLSADTSEVVLGVERRAAQGGRAGAHCPAAERKLLLHERRGLALEAQLQCTRSDAASESAPAHPRLPPPAQAAAQGMRTHAASRLPGPWP